MRLLCVLQRKRSLTVTGIAFCIGLCDPQVGATFPLLVSWQFLRRLCLVL